MSSLVVMGEIVAVENHSQLPDEGASVNTQDPPVSSLPTEILQLIFELVVSFSLPSGRIKAAVLLSGVCCRWRGIAVDTPTLWATLEVISWHDVLTGYYPLVRMAISRIKVAPATVTIHQVDLSHFTSNLPQRWGFFRLANLSSLSIHFQEDRSLVYFTDATFNALRYSPLRRLSVSITWRPWNRPFINIWGIFKIFPNLTHLTLYGVSIAEVEHPLCTSLIYCELQKVSVTLRTVHTAFPNLDRLYLIFMPLQGSRPLSGLQKIPAMRHLTARGTAFFENPDIPLTSYPNLVSIHSTDTSSGHLIEFLRRHPSLKHLDCFLTDLRVAECAKVAPQLAHVCLTASIDPFVRWEEYSLTSPPFPHLKALLLSDCLDPFTVVEFETLVKARFLPIGHPQSLLEGSSLPVEELRIMRKGFVDWKTEDWANHPLCSEAKINVVPYEEEAGSNHIILRWM